VEAAAWRPEDIPQQLLLECPALAAFKVCVLQHWLSTSFDIPVSI
jgi:hypothetical protein